MLQRGVGQPTPGFYVSELYKLVCLNGLNFQLER